MDLSEFSPGVTTHPSLDEENHQRGIMAPVRMVKSDSVGFADSTEPLPSDRQCHILCGDHWNEGYRLSTFSRFPSDFPVKFWKLPLAGFYYLGYRDRVRCFSCGKEVENWLASDNVLSPVWHASDCIMLHRQDSNVERSFYEVIGEVIELSRRWERLGESVQENQNGAEQDQEAVRPPEERREEQQRQLTPSVAGAPVAQDDGVARAQPMRSSNLRRINSDSGKSADAVKRPRRP